jgi:hypothetical protein
MTVQSQAPALCRSRRLTLSLPASLVADLTRLARIRGREFDRELAEDFEFLLRLSGGPKPASMLENLFDLDRQGEPCERVATCLPQPLFDALGAIAHAYDTTRARALAALMQRGVRRLIATETLGLERHLPFAEAFLTLVA